MMQLIYYIEHNGHSCKCTAIQILLVTKYSKTIKANMISMKLGICTNYSMFFPFYEHEKINH